MRMGNKGHGPYSFSCIAVYVWLCRIAGADEMMNNMISKRAIKLKGEC